MTSAPGQPSYEPSRADYNPLSTETTNDPFSMYACVRDETPVFFSPILNWWIVSRYDDIVAVVGDPERFHHTGPPTLQASVPSELADIAPEGINDLPPLSDPQAHLRMRRLVNQVFRPGRIEARESEIRDIVDRLIDDFAHEGHTDLVANFAVPLPMATMTSILGLPEEDAGRIDHWLKNALSLFTANVDDDSVISAWRQHIEYYRYVESLVEERRASPRMGDLVTDLIHAHDGETSAFTTRELVTLVQVLITAGNQTTRALIGSLILRLLEYPEQLAAVRTDPSLAGAVIEEALRHSGPAKGLFRIATDDVQLGGATIPKGQTLQILFASANRDDAEFQHPEEFDLHRADITKHLAFGKGIHFCIGAALARLETRVALQQVLARLPGLRLASADPPQWVPSIVSFGLTRLDVEWDVTMQ